MYFIYFTLFRENQTHCAPVHHLANRYAALWIVARLVGQHTGDKQVCSAAICFAQATGATCQQLK